MCQPFRHMSQSNQVQYTRCTRSKPSPKKKRLLSLKSISSSATNIGTSINNWLKQLLEAIEAQDHMYLEHYH